MGMGRMGKRKKEPEYFKYSLEHCLYTKRILMTLIATLETGEAVGSVRIIPVDWICICKKGIQKQWNWKKAYGRSNKES